MRDGGPQWGWPSTATRPVEELDGALERRAAGRRCRARRRHTAFMPDNDVGKAAAARTARRCPYCQFSLVRDAIVVCCPSCHAVHHDDCWRENGGCAVVYCPSGPIAAMRSKKG